MNFDSWKNELFCENETKNMVTGFSEVQGTFNMCETMQLTAAGFVIKFGLTCTYLASIFYVAYDIGGTIAGGIQKDAVIYLKKIYNLFVETILI